MSSSTHSFPVVSASRISQQFNPTHSVEFAILFYQMLTGVKIPRPIYSERDGKLHCKFADKIQKAPSLDQMIQNPHFLGYFSDKEKKVPGLANSLLISTFLEGLTYASKIVFLQVRDKDQSFYHFLNINLAQMFYQVKPLSVENRSAQEQNIRHLNLDNLFLHLIIEKDLEKIFKSMTDEKPDFLLEAHIFILKAILLPIPQIQEALEEIFFIYSTIQRQQDEWFKRALLNKNFRKFLLESKIQQIAESLVTHIMEALATWRRNGVDIKPQLFKKSISTAVLTRAEHFSTETNLIAFVLEDKDCPLVYKKTFVFSLMKDKILGRQTLREKFAVVKELEASFFDEVRDRSISLRGTAIKTEAGEILPICASFREFIKFVKDHLFDWVIQNNKLDELLANEEIMNFMKSHLDGHWWKQSILDYICAASSGYICETTTAKKIESAIVEKEKKDHAALNAFKKDFQDRLIKEIKEKFKQDLEELQNSIISYVGINAVSQFTEFVSNVSSQVVDAGRHLLTQAADMGFDLTSSLVSAASRLIGTSTNIAAQAIGMSSELTSSSADSSSGQREARAVPEFKFQPKTLRLSVLGGSDAASEPAKIEQCAAFPAPLNSPKA